MSIINEFATKITNPKRIAIIGDILIDAYYPVSVTRISPEHPIPVFHTPDEACSSLPGGAANVCHQFKNFNVETALFGFVNTHAINSLTPNVKSAVVWSVADDTCQVPIKKRYYDKHKEFPMCRIDIETANYGLGETIHQWREQVKKQFLGYLKTHKPHMVICSDYHKGLFDEELCGFIIRNCSSHGIPTIVDPKKNYKQWKGCTYFKLNENEAHSFIPNKDWHEIINELKQELQCQDVIITHGATGAGKYQATKTVDSRSVIGAGDCFAAVFALAITHGFTTDEATEIAWNAGAVYVQKTHNEPIYTHELLAHDDPIAAKVINRSDLSKVIAGDRDNKYVFTNGCFDLMHIGHIETLRFAKSKGTKLIVGINSDASIKRLKGESRPLVTFADRAKVIASLEFVDYVVNFDEDTPYETLQILAPHVLVKGGDYTKDTIVGSDIIPELHIAPTVEGHSTTALISRILLEMSRQTKTKTVKLSALDDGLLFCNSD